MAEREQYDEEASGGQGGYEPEYTEGDFGGQSGQAGYGEQSGQGGFDREESGGRDSEYADSGGTSSEDYQQ